MIDKDKVIQLAKEAGAKFDPHWGIAYNVGTETFTRFAQAIYRLGLEDAAKIVEQKDMDYYGIVPAIRALKESQNG